MRHLPLGFLGILVASAWNPSVAMAATAGRQSLPPASEWLLESTDESCTLSRRFGPAEAPTTLQLRSFGFDSGFRMTLIGNSIRPPRQVLTDTRYRLSPDTVARERAATFNGRIGGLPAVSLSVSFSAPESGRDSRNSLPDRRMAFSGEAEQPDLDFERRIESIEFAFAGGNYVELQLGGMAEPLKRVRDCVDRLKAGWGLDPATERTLTRHPVPDLQSVRRLQNNYPSSMYLAGVSGFIPVRVMVGAQGQAESCTVQNPTPASFEEAVCDGLATRYFPALDGSGQPVASVFLTSVIFLLE